MVFFGWKKTYWRHFDRGLMSKEALHQLLEWADKAADQKGRWVILHAQLTDRTLV